MQDKIVILHRQKARTWCLKSARSPMFLDEVERNISACHHVKPLRSGRAAAEARRQVAARHRVNLVQASAAEFRLASVDVGMVPLRVDERLYCVLRSSAGEEFAISAPPSRMARHPDVNREASEHSKAALEVGLLLWIPRCGQPPQVARAHDVQHAITVTNLERP